jgi:transposase
MFYYGLDVHKRFIQVCRIDAAGKARKDFRVDATREAIMAFAKTLGPGDQVALEATFHTWAIWTLLVSHCGRAVVANPMRVKAIAHARIKTDKVDAHILAQLLRMEFIPEVEMPGEETWELRQLVSHRLLLARKRTAVAERVASRPRDQDGELFDQLCWLEDDMRRAIAPGGSKPVCDPPIGELVEPLSGDRRPRNVPAQSLNSFSIPAPNYHSRVQAEALHARALFPDPQLHSLDLDAIAGPQGAQNPISYVNID